MCEAFKRRRDLFVKGISGINGFKINVPQGAFYLFPDITHFLGLQFNEQVVATADDFAMYLLNNAHVAVVSGSAFGSPYNIRLSYATSDEKLSMAVERIAQAVKLLR